MKPIKTWDEADDLFAELINHDLQIEKNRGEMERRCHEIKEKYGAIIQNHEAKRRDLIEALHSFFIAHEDDPEVKGKTHECGLGRYGLRLTPPSVKPAGKMTWQKVLARILDLGYKSKLLRPVVHTPKDIDRELLASNKINDDIRKEIGVRLFQEERFWYEKRRDYLLREV